MKEIKRFFFLNGVEHESDDGRWVRFDECENYIAARDHVINELENIIKELESEKHINEIKTQGIADYLENDLLQYANLYDANHAVSVEHIEYSINKLRNKHE